MLHRRTTFLATTFVIAGCRSTAVPNTVLQPVRTAPTDNTPINSVGPWLLAPSRQPHTYHSVSQTTVHELSNPTTRRNTIEVTTAFTISLDQSQTPLIISGHIDTVRFSPPNNNPPTLPLLFEGELGPTTLRSEE